MIRTATEGYVSTNLQLSLLHTITAHCVPTGKRDGDKAEFLVIYPRCNQTYLWRRREEIYTGATHKDQIIG